MDECNKQRTGYAIFSPLLGFERDLNAETWSIAGTTSVGIILHFVWSRDFRDPPTSADTKVAVSAES